MAARRKESSTVDIKIRMREPLRAQIERAARRRGVSMNAEMVDRLGRSFDTDSALGGSELAALLRMLAAAANFVEARTGKSMFDDFQTYRAVLTAWQSLVRSLPEPQTGRLGELLEEYRLIKSATDLKDRDEALARNAEAYFAELERQVPAAEELGKAAGDAIGGREDNR